jgi:hypothetical protein
LIWIMVSIEGQKPASVTYAPITGKNAATMNTQIAKKWPNLCTVPWVLVGRIKNKITQNYPDRGGNQTEKEAHGITSHRDYSAARATQ